MYIPKVTNTAGRRQHYLPAAIIGRFGSGAALIPARERRVWVLRRNGTTALQAATSVAYQNNLYASDPDFNIDDLWFYQEQNFNPAIDVVLQEFPGPYRIDTWAHVATYISSNFARSPDFPEQHRRRLGHNFSNNLGERTSVIRFLETFRVSAAVARANWTILRSPAHPLVLNDRGGTAMYDPTRNTNGYVIPLRRNLAAMLSRGPYDKPILWLNGTWRIYLSAGILSAEQARSLNAATWAQCRREVYAGTRDELDQLKQHPPPAPESVLAETFDGATLLGLNRSQRMEGETLLQQILLQGIPAPTDPSRPPVLKI
jgi:hypothetical protein